MNAKLVSRARRGIFGVVIALISAVGVNVIFAPPANAGTLGLTAIIRGAGTVQSVEGGPYTCTRTNGFNHNAESACQRQTFSAVFEAWVWLRPIPADSQWRFARWENCDATRVVSGVQECAAHSGAFSLDERAPRAVFEDIFVPTVAITSGPSGRVNNTTATFTLATNDTLAGFRCRLDGGSTTVCGSSVTYFVGEGAHTFSVFAIDPSGNRTPTDAVRNWTVDLTPPDTTISTGPSGLTSDTTPTFTFVGAPLVDVARYECRIDTGPWVACAAAGYTPAALAAGTHTFDVRAFDQAGNADPTPASRQFRVVTSPPQTTITSGPSGRIRDRTPTFRFTSSIPGSTFQCRVDSGLWRACTSPFTTARLSFGAHTFRVRAKAAGFTDPTPAARSFRVVR
jgi:hypothetical protein